MSKETKKSRDYCGLPRDELKVLNSLSPEEIEEFGGIFGGMRKQTQAERLTVASEEIVGQGKDNNAFIVIGNDRYGPPHTGYGGKAHTQCDSIDLVAGLGGFCPVLYEDLIDWDSSGPTPDAFDEETGLPRMKVETSPNFFLDAARIYIAQKTDVDKNFGIGDEFGKTRERKLDKRAGEDIGQYGAKSAIAVKADNIRLIGRESLRLVTGTDKFNSQGGEIGGKHGIEIVAMNQTSKLQPMVLGDNLTAALKKIVGYIDAVLKIFEAQMKFQLKFNQTVANHDHIENFYAKITLPSFAVQMQNISTSVESMVNTELSCMSMISNLKGSINNHLYDDGPEHILSKLNKAN